MTPAEVLNGFAYAVPVGVALGVLVAALSSWGRA